MQLKAKGSICILFENSPKLLEKIFQCSYQDIIASRTFLNNVLNLSLGVSWWFLKSSTLDIYENMFMSINLCQSDTLYIYDYLD